MTASTREVAGSCLYHFWAMPSKAVPGDWQLAQPPRTLSRGLHAHRQAREDLFLDLCLRNRNLHRSEATAFSTAQPCSLSELDILG